MAEVTVRYQPTPNPNAGKFVVDRQVVEGRSRSYFDVEAARGDPVGEALMAIEGVDSVFMVKDFITVTKSPAAGWPELIPRVEEAIRATLS